MKSLKTTAKSRDAAFEALRGIAIVAVVAIHAGNSGWKWYGKDVGEWNYYFTLAIKQIYVFAVPTFFFIAGYFVAGNEYIARKQYLQFFGTRLQRILIPYVIWSAIIVFLVKQNYDFSEFAFNIFFGRTLPAYYFFFVLTCLTILTPFLIWLQRKPYGLSIVILVNAISLFIIYYFRLCTVDGLSGWKGSLSFTTWIIFYYLGLIWQTVDMESFSRVLSEKKALILVIATLAFSTLEAFILVKFYGKYSGGGAAVKFSSFFYSTAVIFYFLIVREKNGIWPRSLVAIGGYSFGIYLIHGVIRGRISSLLSSSSLLFSIQPVFQLIVITLTLFVSILIIYVSRSVFNRNIISKYFGF